MKARMLSEWIATRRAMRMGADALARRRARLWAGMTPALARTPALAAHAGRPLAEYPVVTPAAMRCNPEMWNSAGIGRGEASAAAHEAEAGGAGLVRDGISAGLSTGTSGDRGIFLASASERAAHVGQSIARLLPWHAPLTGARIALVLRADSELYRDVGRGRFDFMHMPLGLAADEMADRLVAFSPTVLIAPPRELAALARRGWTAPSSIDRLFYGSEPMAKVERAMVTEAIGKRPDPIYQATEGFLGAACHLGSLHLNDDSLKIELEAVEGTDLHRPIVTDLRRTTQPMVRVRMDDLLRRTICTCGSARRAIEVVGRVQDIWHVGGNAIAPDAIDDHFTAAMPRHAAWRVVGRPGSVAAEIAVPEHAAAMRDAIAAIHPGANATITNMPDTGDAKRRRVRWEKA